MAPLGDNGQQARTKTIAEDKRAMGFPDDYRLCGTAEQVSRCLGNILTRLLFHA